MAGSGLSDMEEAFTAGVQLQLVLSSVILGKNLPLWTITGRGKIKLFDNKILNTRNDGWKSPPLVEESFFHNGEEKIIKFVRENSEIITSEESEKLGLPIIERRVWRRWLLK